MTDDLQPSTAFGCWVCGAAPAVSLDHRADCPFHPEPTGDAWLVQSHSAESLAWETRGSRPSMQEAETLALELLALAVATRVVGPGRSATYRRSE